MGKIDLSTLFDDMYINDIKVDEDMRNLVDRVISDYNKYGCRSKIDYSLAIESINSEIDELIRGLNYLSVKFISKEVDINNYRRLKFMDFPGEYSTLIYKLISRLRSRLSAIRQIEEGEMYSIRLYKRSRGSSYFETKYLPEGCDNNVFAGCIENDLLVTFKLRNLVTQYGYINSSLSKYLGNDFFNNIMDLVKSHNVECSMEDLRSYLNLRTISDNYEESTYYRKHRSVLDSIDKVLSEYVIEEDIIKNGSMHDPITHLVLSVIKKYDDVYLYHYRDSIFTFRLSNSVKLDEFLESFNEELVKSDIWFTNPEIVFSNSLNFNLSKLKKKS